MSIEISHPTINLAPTASEQECSADSCTHLPATISASKVHHEGDNIVKELQKTLCTQSDMVIDFSSLKTCLNPMGVGDAQTLEKECDYEDFVHDLIENQTEKLPNLEKLTIRRVAKKPEEQYDYYAQLSHGIMQMSCLSELDLCQIPAIFHDLLQLWNLHNLKKLSITESKLKSLSGSVGRLQKLEFLDLSHNHLTRLPITLSFCKDLNTLDLHSNHFRQLPGVILQLPNLQTLRRLQNPLTPRYECYGPHYTRKISSKVQDGKTVYQPLSLQASCTTVVFTSKLEYWNMDFIGPLQCKTLDRLATQFIICDNCARMLPDKDKVFQMEVLLITFAELSGVPFLLNACNETCQKELMDTYGEKNVQLQKQLDRNYEASILQAQREVENGTVDLGPSPGPYTPPHPWNTTPPYRAPRSRHRRKRCSIM